MAFRTDISLVCIGNTTSTLSMASRLRHEGIELTNNAGERALRHAVIWRKLSFGTQSANGSRFVETMLTVIETCRQQHRNAFEYLTATMEAHLGGRSAPSSTRFSQSAGV